MNIKDIIISENEKKKYGSCYIFDTIDYYGTVTTKGCNARNLWRVNDNGRWRTETPTECAVIQGFQGYGFMENGVDKFSWYNPNWSKSVKFRLLGNSVSIPVIECIANFIRQELERLDKERDK